MKRLRIYLLPFAMTFAAACAHAQPASLEQNIRARAEAAAFDGAILIGEADGSHRILMVGDDPVARDAVWRWASITKQLAAVLVMQEVAAGRIDLDAPVTRYWPEWRAPNGNDIRIRDLLRHNSGLPQPDESPADDDGVPAFYRSAAVPPTEAAGAFCAGPARADPPAEFDYNNCDSIVIAELLHRITGKSFATLLEERLAEPLGLDSLTVYGLADDHPDHVRPTGEHAEIDPLLDLGVYGASGGAYGTIADLWTFDHALLNGALIPDAAREAMWESGADNGFYAFFQWVFPAHLSGCPAEERIVERQGQIAGIELRNYLLPRTGRGLILFSRHRPAEYGDPWEGSGFAYDLLSEVNCR